MVGSWFRKSGWVGLLVLALGSASPQQAKADMIGPSPYLAFDNALPGAGTAISPFAGLNFSYFHLETFEDALFNVPGVTASSPNPAARIGLSSVVFGPSLRDSVDADDGVINGTGVQGESYFTNVASAGIRFTFDAGVLGSLPTHAGITWVDGAGQITFRAFAADGSLLGTIGPVSQAGVFPDNSFLGTTGEDRFFGATSTTGISAIFISNTGGGMEVDHLQYGRIVPSNDPGPNPGPENPVPGPASGVLITIGMMGFAGYRKMRRT
ncbi:MAG: hypothetical protein ACRC8S_03160 [Fimbriiglobus sp.]